MMVEEEFPVGSWDQQVEGHRLEYRTPDKKWLREVILRRTCGNTWRHLTQFSD